MLALAFIGVASTYTHIVLTALSYSLYLTLSDRVCIVYFMVLTVALSEFLHSTGTDDYPFAV